MSHQIGHPIHGLYDKLFFDMQGEIVPGAFYLDKHFHMFKLGNRFLDIDHVKARQHFHNGSEEDKHKSLYPIIRMWEGSGQYFDYSFTVEDADTPQDSTFFIAGTTQANVTSYFGGLAIVAHKDNKWTPISKETFEVFIDWANDLYLPVDNVDPEITSWLDTLNKNGLARISKSTEEILKESIPSLTAKNNNLVVVSDKEPDVIKPISLVGMTMDLDKGVQALEVLPVKEVA